MVKIDFEKVVAVAKTPKPVALTLFVNWAIKPFTMFLIAWFFLGYLFKGYLPRAEILKTGQEVELWRSYISGTILLGIAPCTAMVLMWSYLAKGNDRLTLVMVAINSLTMIVSICKKTCNLFKECKLDLPQCKILQPISNKLAIQ